MNTYNSLRLRLGLMLAAVSCAAVSMATTTSTEFDPADAGTAFSSAMGPMLTAVVPVVIGILLVTAAPKIIMRYIKRGTKV